MPSQTALHKAIDEVFEARIGDISGRSKLGADMRTIWLMQPRFDKRTAMQSCHSLIAQLRYRAGFDFLCLRAAVGEVDEALVNWWQTFSQADDAVRYDLVSAVRAEQRQHTQKAKTQAKKLSTTANSDSAPASAPSNQLTAAEQVVRDLIYSRLDAYQVRKEQGVTTQQLVDELQAEGHPIHSVEQFQKLYARAKRKRATKRRKTRAYMPAAASQTDDAVSVREPGTSKHHQ